VIAGAVITPLGILLWPLLPVGFSLSITSNMKAESARNQCMSSAGYLKGPAIAKPPAVEEKIDAWWDEAPTAKPWIGLDKK
jgi:hypothetical protein